MFNQTWNLVLQIPTVDFTAKRQRYCCKPAIGVVGKGCLASGNLIIRCKGVGIRVGVTDQVITGLLVKSNIGLDCRGIGIRAIYKHSPRKWKL
ncbi:MAG: hypothetical protein GX799_09585 [Crenarchaeota archaeon]|nr:hypothetical protein [Thermoproteota archaeon]